MIPANLQGGVVALAAALIILGIVGSIVVGVWGSEPNYRSVLRWLPVTIAAAVLGMVLLGLFADLGAGYRRH